MRQCCCYYSEYCTTTYDRARLRHDIALDRLAGRALRVPSTQRCAIGQQLCPLSVQYLSVHIVRHASVRCAAPTRRVSQATSAGRSKQRQRAPQRCGAGGPTIPAKQFTWSPQFSIDCFVRTAPPSLETSAIVQRAPKRVGRDRQRRRPELRYQVHCSLLDAWRLRRFNLLLALSHKPCAVTYAA